MTVTKDMLLSELQQLLRMTSFEQTIATIRRTQARDTPVSQELAANAEKSAERQALLTSAVRQVGGVPDVVGQAVGKVGAFWTAQLNQVQTLQGALLGDLTLEHQLRERTRYARTLAESLGYHQVLPVLDRLEVAHTATIEWLEERLGEVGRTGTSALQATPVQTAVMATRRVLGTPYFVTAATVNRLSSLLSRGAGKAADTAQDAARTATTAAGNAAEAAGTAVSGAVGAAGTAATTAAGSARDAAAAVAGTTGDAAGAVAASAGDAASGAAEAAASAGGQVVDLTERASGAAASSGNAALGEVGSLNDNSGVAADGANPPFPGYDKLTGDRVIRHVGESSDVPDLQVLLAYEQANKARKGVVQAAEARLQELGSGVGAGR